MNLSAYRLFFFIALTALISGCSGGGNGGESASNSNGASLSNISVNGSTKALNPQFRSEVLRYSLIDSPESDNLSITLDSESTSVVSILGNIVADDVPFVLTDDMVGTTIDIVVSGENGETTAYDLVYLPADFPELITTIATNDAADGDLYLALKQRGTDYTTNYVASVDNNAVPKFYKRTDLPANNFTRHANGEYSYSLQLLNGEQTSTGRFSWEHVILDENFVENRRIKTAGLQHTDFHEFKLLTNGNPVLLAYEPSQRDLSQFGGSSNGDVEDSVIQELDGLTGDVLYEWNSWGRVKYEDELRDAPFDYAHINSFDFTENGDMIFVARGTSQISRIDRSSGTLLWTFGGKSNEFTFINDPYSNLCGPHTASILENGNILVFDNGQYCWPENPSRGDLTRIVEYKLDEQAKTAELVWSYSKPGAYSLSGGSAQRLENGNTLIGWNRGPDVLVTEVNSTGDIVFELSATYDDVAINSYRAYRFR